MSQLSAASSAWRDMNQAKMDAAYDQIDSDRGFMMLMRG